MSRRSKTPRIAPTHTPKGIQIGPRNTSFGRLVTLVNPTDQHSCRHRFIFAFGMIAPTYLMVWSDGIEDALDEAMEWCAEHAPGLLCDAEVAAAFKEALAEGKDEGEAIEAAEADTTQSGSGHYVRSEDWAIVAEDPTRAQLDALLFDPGVLWPERARCADDYSRWNRCARRRDPQRRMYDAPLPAGEPCAPHDLPTIPHLAPQLGRLVVGRQRDV